MNKHDMKASRLNMCTWGLSRPHLCYHCVYWNLVQSHRKLLQGATLWFLLTQ